MPDFTKLNIKDLDDLAAGRGTGIEARFARSSMDSEHLGLTYMRFDPDTLSPFAHSHGEQEEVYVVTAGSAQLKLDDEVIDVGPWDVIRVAPAVVRAFRSGPDGLELLIAGSDRPADGDGEISPIDAFWSI